VLQASLGEADVRMESLAAQDTHVAQLNQRVDALTTRYQELFAQSDALNGKQQALEALHARLAEVDELSARTTTQLTTLNQSRTALEALKKEIVEFQESYAGAAKLRDTLGADRAALEGFIERVSELSARTP
jgi:DNA repair exonuclease SbcCD ATPase subunit